MVYYVHSPIGNDLRTIPGTNVQVGRIRLKGRKYENVYFCPKCGRDMIFLKEASAFFCTHCSFTQYISKQQTGQDPNPIAVDNSIVYVGNPSSNKPKMRSMGDPRKRSRFNKDIIGLEGPDEETKQLAEHNNAYIVDYKETLPT